MSHEGRVRNIERVWLVVSELNRVNTLATPYVIVKHAVSILGVTQGTAESYLGVLYKGLSCQGKVIYVEAQGGGLVAKQR